MQVHALGVFPHPPPLGQQRVERRTHPRGIFREAPRAAVRPGRGAGSFATTEEGHRVVTIQTRRAAFGETT